MLPIPCARISNRPIDIDGLSFEELLELNQRVSFEHGGGRLMGTLVKYNRKTVTVVTDNGQRWNISPHLLSAVKDAGTAQPKQLAGKKKKRLR